MCGTLFGGFLLAYLRHAFYEMWVADGTGVARIALTTGLCTVTSFGVLIDGGTVGADVTRAMGCPYICCWFSMGCGTRSTHASTLQLSGGTVGALLSVMGGTVVAGIG